MPFRPVRRGRALKTARLPEQWLDGPFSTSGTPLDGATADLEAFKRKLQTGLPPPSPQSAGSVPNLSSPEPPRGGRRGKPAWRLSFHLQASDDPSLLVPAELAWRERASTLTFLARSFENPQERLLADLGRASRFSPDIERSLHSARPTGLDLATGQAYDFLCETAPLLKQSGFGAKAPPCQSRRMLHVCRLLSKSRFISESAINCRALYLI